MTERELLCLHNFLVNTLTQMDIQPYDSNNKILDRLATVEDTFRADLTNGASKYCLVLEDYPFVIKWARRDGFCSLPEGEAGEAYQEALLYKKAAKEGLQFLFPYTGVLAEINGIIFVIQEKVSFSANDLIYSRNLQNTKKRYVKMVENQSDHIARKMEKEINRHESAHCRDLDYLWAKMVILMYGKKMAKRLCKFLNENKINDLHSSNIGYLHNKPIILDFAGFHR